MMTAHDSQKLAEAVLRQHAALNQQIDSLNEILQQQFDWSQLGDMMENLEECLGRHFDLEEQGGYLSEVLEAAPRSQPQVDRLLKEHQLMIETLRQARDLTSDGASRQELRTLLGGWLDLFHDHEARENRLALNVFNTDLGGGD